ncbi:hypothetical protein [Sphingomonas sanxanigenens]|uniref:Uncharacterized protein n=1 Tax=Sphingomonas sanxanigenens DSM 19645 = NX02 TaxID=1123269 RepID=W0AGY4_9SPHN|nr:hypothetical protein [Sphingomonas sanxanigenens]AHE57159.1 hypothetical protein NX02_27880 [Sphingomonas sanxanigenens DSM 19645 = NX02]
MVEVSGARIAGAVMAAAFAGVAMMIAIFMGMMMFGGGAEALIGLPAIIFFGMIFGLPIALGHILILGMPAWLLLNHWRPLGRIGTAALGMVIGAVPVTILGFVDPPANPLTQVAFSAAFGAAGVIAALAFLRIVGGRRTQ